MEMDEVFEKLRTLQDILSEKIILEKKKEESPKQLDTQQELLSRMVKDYKEKTLEFEKGKLVESDLRNSLADSESMRETAEKHMEATSTQREYEAVDKEIKDANEKEQQYRKELLKQERYLSDLEDQMKQRAELIEQQKQEYEERRTGIEAEIDGINKQLEDLSMREKTINPDLDPEVLFKFDRIVRNKGGRGIVAIKSGVCMGCHMILPAQFANKVRQGKEIVFCPYCSRILYYEESEQGEEDFFDVEDSGSLSDLDDLEEEDFDEEEEEEEKVNIDYEE